MYIFYRMLVYDGVYELFEESDFISKIQPVCVGNLFLSSTRGVVYAAGSKLASTGEFSQLNNNLLQ